MLTSTLFFAALALPAVFAAPAADAPTPVEVAKRATCTVSSAAAAASVSSCSTVVITGFTVPSGTTVDFKFATGASVTMTGDIVFSKTTSAGPLLTLEGTSVTFNGGDHNINGNGALYWDGEGTNGGVAKPHPFVKVKISGTFEDVTILNSPAQAISLGNDAALLVHGVNVDNSAGDAGALGHNTDGFDVSTSDVTIQDCVVKNQDDCIAINAGSNIVFENNQCSGGHGISIGSIASSKTVSNVKIANNVVTNSMYGLRIKVDADATSASVSTVTYEGNTVSGISKYGILISQSYPDDFSTPGTGSTISGINFTGSTTSVSVSSSATRVGIDCGKCSGTWNWASLSASGGKGDDLVLGGATISGGSY
ncbi:polygalacturonase [Clavulina sp. PMI_390]|nr:polygalacturonase [Clavulina sp. PMI_390]